MLALYMDHHVPRVITDGLRLRGIDVITAYEDGAGDMDETQHYWIELLNSVEHFSHKTMISSPRQPNDKKKELLLAG